MDYFALGLGVGVLAGLLVYGARLLALRRRAAACCRYDERQQAARGRAFRAAFLTHLIYAALVTVLTAGGASWLDVPEALFLGVVIAVGVFAQVCIWNDAYFELSEKPRATILPLVLLGVLQLLNVWRHVAEDGWLPGGRIDFITLMGLSVGALMLLTVVTALIKLSADRRREARDEES